MQLAKYEQSGQTTYAGLAEIVGKILTAAVVAVPNLHPQQIQHRAKDIGSLRTKLAKAGAAEAGEIEPHAKDLAGARIIFYTNSDVSRFQNSGILTDNFEVDWERTKIHHPAAENADASELFVSNNYVVRLKGARAALPEYAPFAGLWCEVQVQTTLNHAWAEMAHDTIYRKPQLTGFGRELMKGIEARMAAIMRDYLAPAGYAFQKVLRDVERLSQGQALFEQGIVQTIESADDNNALQETLSNFRSSVLPYYDDWQEEAVEILQAVVRAVERSRGLPTTPRHTPFGDLEGRSSKDVANIAAAIIEDLRFVDVDQTFDLICTLYRNAEGEEAAAWVKLAGELAQHHLHAWQQAGPVVQGMLMNRVMAMSPQERQTLKPVVLAVLQEVFGTDLSATTSSGDTITIHQGPVIASDALRQMRADALQIVFAYNAPGLSEDERREIIDVLLSAMVMPSHGQPVKPDLGEIVLSNASEVVRHFTATCAAWSYEQRQKIEDRMLWKYRHYGAVPPDELTDEAQERARTAMVVAIMEFRDALNQDRGFTTYKLLVGFESVFPPAWDKPDFDYAEEETYRKEQFGPLIESITAENAEAWLATIRRCAATKSNDLATFPPFSEFLQRLSATKPEIVLGYLHQLDGRLANFLPSFLLGVAQTPLWEEAKGLLNSWIADGSFLPEITFSVGAVDALDVGILESALDAAIAAGDEPAALSAIRSISRRDAPDAVHSLKPLFLKAVSFLSQQNEYRWHNYWHSRRKEAALINAVSEAEIIPVLDSLVKAPRMEPSLEWLLADIAAVHPQPVIDYMGKRIARRFANGREADYNAVPYGLHRLDKALSEAAALVITSARGWYDTQPDFFSYYGGKLVKAVFPKFSPALEDALHAYVGTNDPQDTKFVLETLRAYSGEAFLHSLAKDIVASLPADGPLLDFVELVLEPSGMTSGEFGRVNRLKRHREAIATWAEDLRDPVKTFADRYGRQVDNSIRAEQRRSEERAALRRLEYERIAPEAEGEADDAERGAEDAVAME